MTYLIYQMFDPLLPQNSIVDKNQTSGSPLSFRSLLWTMG